MNPHPSPGLRVEASEPNPAATVAAPAQARSSPTIVEPRPLGPHVSGRPADLLPGHRVVTIDGGDLWMEAEAFVYEMYVKIGYTEPSPRHQVEELARWSEQSRFHAVLDEHDHIIGTIRTIFGRYTELPVAQFERTNHDDPDPVCEFSSLVVDPTQRSTGVIEHLYRAGWLDASRSGANGIVALIDEWLYEAFVDIYRLPFRRIGVGQHYMGTDPVPVAMPLYGDNYLDMARTNPHFYAWNVEGCDPEEVAEWEMPIVLLDPRAAAEAPVADRAVRQARRD